MDRIDAIREPILPIPFIDVRSLVSGSERPPDSALAAGDEPPRAKARPSGYFWNCLPLKPAFPMNCAFGPSSSSISRKRLPVSPIARLRIVPHIRPTV